MGNWGTSNDYDDELEKLAKCNKLLELILKQDKAGRPSQEDWEKIVEAANKAQES